MDPGYRKALRGYKNSCFGNKSTLKSWGIAEFVSAAAVSQRFSVSHIPSPRRQPCCHCLFLQANLPAHHLLWEPPWEQGRAHAGVGQPYPGASKVEGAVLHREMSGQREQELLRLGEPRAPTPVTQPPPLDALPFCSTAVTQKGTYCPNLTPAPAAGVCLSI